MKISKFFEHFQKSILIKLEDKSLETYQFIQKYLDVIEFQNYIDNPNLYQIVARDLDQIIGLIIYKMKDGKIHINYTAVDSSRRLEGINTKMLQEIERIANDNNISVITTNVRSGNQSSINSFIKSGFQINTNYDLYYPDGERKIPLFKRL